MKKHEQQDWYNPDPSINRDVYIPMTCTNCGVERDMADWGDGTHAMNIVEIDGKLQYLIDHGELAQQKSTQDILDSGI